MSEASRRAAEATRACFDCAHSADVNCHACVECIAAAIARAVAEVQVCNDEPCNSCVACLQRTVMVMNDYIKDLLKAAAPGA